jgi:arsenite methyltransferase
MARDLMFQQEIKETVQRAYAAITGGAGETVARRHYSDQDLAEIPPEAVQWALGVGNPVRYARLQPGQTVLDVGSGGGIDTILAARRVGPEGRAIGLDVLEEMCERGRRHAAQAGVEGWTEFRRGDMEAIPLPGRVGRCGHLQRGAEPVGPQEPGPGRDLPGAGAGRSDLHGRSDRGGRAASGGGQ